MTIYYVEPYTVSNLEMSLICDQNNQPAFYLKGKQVIIGRSLSICGLNHEILAEVEPVNSGIIQSYNIFHHTGLKEKLTHILKKPRDIYIAKGLNIIGVGNLKSRVYSVYHSTRRVAYMSPTVSKNRFKISVKDSPLVELHMLIAIIMDYWSISQQLNKLNNKTLNQSTIQYAYLSNRLIYLR